MFILGNFVVKEILYVTLQNFSDDILAVFDEISGFNLDVAVDSIKHTDKNGNTYKTTFRNKSATCTLTGAMMSVPMLSMNHTLSVASESNKLTMPQIKVLRDGASINIKDKSGSVSVVEMTYSGSIVKIYDKAEVSLMIDGDRLTVPNSHENHKFMVRYERYVSSGIKLVNGANDFSKTMRMTLYASVIDPCDGKTKAMYFYIPNFTPSPECAISLNSDNTQQELTGEVNVDYCGCLKALYYCQFASEEALAMQGSCVPLPKPTLTVSTKNILLSSDVKKVRFTVRTNSDGKVVVSVGNQKLAAVKEVTI